MSSHLTTIIMLQVLNDVMKMELVADKQCGEIEQVRCYSLHVFACSAMYYVLLH